MSTEIVGIGGAIGVFLPVIISFIQQQQWSARVQSLVAAGVCILTGLLATWTLGDFNLADAGATVTAVLVTSAATYQGYWKALGLRTGQKDAPAQPDPH